MCDVWKKILNKMSCQQHESPPAGFNLKILLATERMLSAIYRCFTATTLIFVTALKLPWIFRDKRK
jgi:hypothetical protein